MPARSSHDRPTSAGSPSGSLLVYTDVDELTITRRKLVRGWGYYDGAHRRIKDGDEIKRLNAIALPPAYGDARFNPDPFGHLQAIGSDARGRRQYRYHPDFRAAQELEKFSGCDEFGRTLPRLRQQLEADLAAPPTSRAAVLSAMVRILDTEYLRIGNECYSRANKSFGLSTLQRRHVKIRGPAVELRYRGKGGIMRSVRLTDRVLLRIMRRCQDLRGQRLFQYVDDSGDVRSLGSNDVNVYLREHLGADYTAKHFRTWHASVLAFEALVSGESVREALLRVSDALGNTPAIARKSYVHPGLLDPAPDPQLPLKIPRPTRWLNRFERGFLLWLESKNGLSGNADSPD
jgi:DNA topoisomerase I